MSLKSIYGEEDSSLYEINTHAEGPKGSLPLTPQLLKDSPSGNIFGMTLNAGMGWEPSKLLGGDVLILSNQGGIRDNDGTPIAVGLHTGHFELGLQMRAAAEEIKKLGGVPYAAYVTDPCDGRSQGTTGMFDSLPYRNDSAIVCRRLIRSLPTRRAVMGVASCDKGLPAMMMALVSMHDLPTIIVPGGATLKAIDGEDAGTIQTIGVRFANNELSLEDACRRGCNACASAGGGCQFLGTAGTSQVIAEALGIALPHSALAPSGQPIWKEIARQSAKAVLDMADNGIATKNIITDEAIENAMVVHAAFGGSTNLLLHLPAIAHAANCKIPTVEDWARINKKVPRLVSVLPIGPVNYPTVSAFLAGGVPEVMLHLRKLGLLHEDVLTVTGETLGDNLDWWEKSERRAECRKRLLEVDKINPDEIIMNPSQAKERGLTSTVTFPVGNIAPEGSVVKSTAIDPSVIGDDGVFRHTGKVKVFTSEKAAIKALKDAGKIKAGDIMIVMGGGPMGTGMEETYQLTSALKHLSFGKHVSLITDARFSGVSTGACFGHVGPEALAGGPIGKLRDEDIIEIIVDTNKLEGSINFIGTEDNKLSYEEAAKVLESRKPHPDLKPDADLPDDTRLWAALQSVSGGTWRGSVYDVDKIIEVLEAGKKALTKK
ncbi:MULTISPECIES: YjhG/YagF family D-xylonate dehydratase [Clostridium]|uniref:Dihydroxy-acid dehydratase n=3 Tax=Clostridium TaxID=1485 RepID=D8GK50_CLOLD|nr:MULTISPECIES: YjhG/YagF family D-xylonate dehydratase [Clostridium]ADK13168.1 predicted dehydratase [Clostridium ljungdahlii DSM 13528]AGY76392.1 YjhG/YagF family D-xylonate dehydratase [Clostridium autoethanogenum DSM 10061]ALU36555.1 Dehydratase YjhG/YagF family [Clostridium autoethanogenum DSM 10061]OAA84407.1 Dihydroxy-acid dehydratase [Clostridium ljungdahlii DSM 13528]OVY48641.1 Dihydroxy-acid dehydratase [Clostridium autoethanogenum]